MKLSVSHGTFADCKWLWKNYMAGIIQPKGTKGSLRWIKNVINDFPGVLSRSSIDAIV